MKIQDYEKVRDLLRSREKLDKLNRIFNHPYLLSFSSRREVEAICFSSLDKQTQEELKKVFNR